MQDEEVIRRRAHEIWDREGRPDGRHEEHWKQAQQQLSEEGINEPAPVGQVTPTGGQAANTLRTGEQRSEQSPPPPDLAATEASRIID